MASRFPSAIAREAAGWFAGKEFTNDWLTDRTAEWLPVLQRLRDRPLSILEVGSFEGRSAIFLLEYLPQSRITCIDPFVAAFSAGYEERFDRNTAGYGGRVEKIKSPSIPALHTLRTAGRRFDLIYIDGSHERYDVLCDSVLAWPLLDVGGVLIWDDWGGNKPGRASERRPQQAIDLFCSAFAPAFRVRHRRYQVIVQKTADWPRQPLLARALRFPARLGQRAWWTIRRNWYLWSDGFAHRRITQGHPRPRSKS